MGGAAPETAPNGNVRPRWPRLVTTRLSAFRLLLLFLFPSQPGWSAAKSGADKGSLHRRSRITLRSIRATGGGAHQTNLGRKKRAARTILHVVIAGLDPAIHAAVPLLKIRRRAFLPHFSMDRRVKPGSDGNG